MKFLDHSEVDERELVVFLAKYNIGRDFSHTDVVWFDIGMHVAVLM
jgi:hypothetical protein